jgi:membrane protein implicated in regulation of membrane protease activity
METMTIIWLVLAVVMAVLEAATVQLVSIWFVIGSVAACVTSLITDSILIQAIVFVAVTAIALIATRPLVKKIRSKKAEPTNSDRYIGMEGVVTSAIDNLAAAGQVRVGGSVWTARSADDNPIPEGTRVTVTAIEGVKLIVKPL